MLAGRHDTTISRLLRRGARCGSLLFLGLALSACSDNASKVESLRAEAELAQGAGDAEAGLSKLREALRLRPRDATVNLALARALEAANRSEDAAFYFAETRRLDPTSIEAATGEIRAILPEEPDRAWRLVVALIERFPDQADVRVQGARVALARGDLSAARYHTLTATELDSDDAEAYLALAEVQLLRSRQHGEKALKESLVAAERADSLSGSAAAKAVFARAVALDPVRVEEADAAFLEAVRETGEIPADTPRARTSKAEALAGITEHALAFARSRQDGELTRDILEARVGVGGANLGRWQELAAATEATGGSGRSVWLRLMDERGDELAIQLAYFAYLEGRGEIEALRAALRETIEAEPDRPGLRRRQIAFFLGNGGNVEAGLAEMRARFPDHPELGRAEALVSLDRGDARDAARRLASVVDRQPTAGALAELAEAELAGGDALAAVAAADRGLAVEEMRHDQELQLRSVRSRSALLLRDWPEVVAQLEQILALRSLSDSETIHLASARYAIGSEAEARGLLDSVLSKASWPGEAALLFSERHGATEPDRARQLIDTALDRSPEDPALVAHAVQLDLAAGASGRAKARLDRSIEGNSKEPETLLLLRARILRDEGDARGAAEDARKAFDGNPRLEGAVEALVSTHREIDREEIAFQLLDQADKAQRLDSAGFADACRAWIQKSDYQRALPLCQSALAEQSDLASAQRDLAYLLARRGGADLDQALGLAQEAIEALNSDSDSSATLGYLYWRKRLYDPAVTYLERALEQRDVSAPEDILSLGPTHSLADVHYFLGQALDSAGHASRAAGAHERAVSLDPTVDERLPLPESHSRAH